MYDYRSLPIGHQAPRIVHAVVEIPAGSSMKYEYDAGLGVFRLDRVLYSPVHYPTDYGFIPSACAADKDPLDILVLLSRPTFPGCVLVARLIGLLHMVDEKGKDEKILVVAERDPHYQRLEDVADVEPHLLKEIEHFFQVYKSLESGISLTFGWEGKAEAWRYIETCRVAA
jgi:inorganic pyrophosphatase